MKSNFLLAGLVLLCGSGTSLAHTFATPYTLPVPFWMYAYGASAALVLSFVIVGLVSRDPNLTAEITFAGSGAGHPPSTNEKSGVLPGLGSARIASVFFLGLTIATGMLGTQNSFANFNMTFFWIIFVLGFAYLTAVFGGVYDLINPWRTLCEWIETRRPQAFQPVWANYPDALGAYPALLLYMGFIWLELFGHTTPRSLALALIAYTAINLAGARLFGLSAWFRHGEFFGVFLRLIAYMAPIAYTPQPAASRKGKVTFKLQQPFVGLLREQPGHFSMVVFILFTLSSTAYDGVHESGPWSRVFWAGIYPLIEPLVIAISVQPYMLAAKIFHQWQWVALFGSPVVYLALFLGALKLMQLTLKSTQSLNALALAFAHTLVPIAFAYHVSHYYTLLLSQGTQLAQLAIDPFGWGWNPLGLASTAVAPVFIDANIIWHTQVGVILAGHVVSVYLAHIVSLRLFGNARRAMLSQWPMLLLMVGLTAGGLWILSLPIAATTVALPTELLNKVLKTSD